MVQSEQRIGCGLYDRGVGIRFPVEARDFFLFTTSRPALGPNQPPLQGVKLDISSVNRQGSEAHRSSPSIADLKDGGAVTSLLHTP
jgi:hypothetical protein